MDYIDVLGDNNKNNLQISSEIKDDLLETSKWAQFLSILGFVFLGIMILIVLIFLAFFKDAMGIGPIDMGPVIFGIGFTYLLLLGLICLPIFFTYKFADLIKDGINNNNQLQITNAFKYLKNIFKFYGIFAIIMIALNIITVVFNL